MPRKANTEVTDAMKRSFFFPQFIPGVFAASGKLTAVPHEHAARCEETLKFSQDGLKARLQCSCGWRGPTVSL